MKKLLLIIAIAFCGGVGYGQCWFSIDAGSDHSLAVKQDGTLWAWGLNYFGTLGLGNFIDKALPTKVGIANNWQEVYAGRYSSYAIKQDGTLWAWGNNEYGQLGIGNLIDKNVPTQVGTGSDWMQITSGSNHTFGLKNDGSLWGWGDMGASGLGDGTSLPRLIPTRIGTQTYVNVSTSADHTLAIHTNGKLFSWGSGIQLGNNSSGGINMAPTQVGTDNWLFASAGFTHSLGVKNDNSLWAWGQNYNNQLGDGTATDRTAPVRIGTDNDWYEVHAGVDASRGIKSSAIFTGKIYGWGYTGSLGQPSSTYLAIPTQNGISNNWFRMSKFSGIEGGYYPHNLWLDYTGTIYSSGINLYGQIGDGTNIDRNILTPIGCGTALPITLITFTATKNQNGTLLNWQTATETNNKGFEIESSTDGISFTKIGFVAGANNSTLTKQYQYTDNAICSGKQFYRLKQIDNDGIFKYSDVATVFCSPGATVIVLPNPAASIVKIIAQDVTAIKLFNSAGVLALQATPSISNTHQVNVNNLPNGLYWLRLQLKDGSVVTEKIQVIH